MSNIPDLLQSHYEDPYHRGAAERATHSAQATDTDSRHFVVMQLQTGDHGVIDEAWFDARGCLYCEAPASILAEFCESKSIAELHALGLHSYFELTQLDRVTNRPSCCELPLIALQNALRSAELDPEADSSDTLTFGGPSLGEET